MKSLHDKIVEQVPQLVRGMVWCRTCGRKKNVSPSACIAVTGWPKCCGYTMTIDSPEEQAAFDQDSKKAE